jgi:flagellar biosynthesis protein
MAQRPRPKKDQPARETAVALHYAAEREGAPRVVAKGKGLVAQKIKQIAQANHIPIHQDDDLVELLAQIEIDREIPAELYGAVAEILSWIYRANTAMKQELSS